MQHREDGGVGAETQGDREDRDESEAGRPRKRLHGVAQVLEEKARHVGACCKDGSTSASVRMLVMTPPASRWLRIRHAGVARAGIGAMLD
jgi:hypothetical protein